MTSRAATRSRIPVPSTSSSRCGPANRPPPDRFGRQNGGMRADRLVAILLMLQIRGQVTAAEVAAELEISERTARRDLEASGMAGLPIYSRQGRNGGWQLAGGGRTDLSGLNAAEARALFLVAGPASSATPELKAALRKLVPRAAGIVPHRGRGRDDIGARRSARLGPAGTDGARRAISTRCSRRWSTVNRSCSATSHAIAPRRRASCIRSGSRRRDRRGTSSPTPRPACGRSASIA